MQKREKETRVQEDRRLNKREMSVESAANERKNDNAGMSATTSRSCGEALRESRKEAVDQCRRVRIEKKSNNQEATFRHTVDQTSLCLSNCETNCETTFETLCKGRRMWDASTM